MPLIRLFDENGHFTTEGKALRQEFRPIIKPAYQRADFSPRETAAILMSIINDEMLNEQVIRAMARNRMERAAQVQDAEPAQEVVDVVEG